MKKFYKNLNTIKLNCLICEGEHRGEILDVWEVCQLAISLSDKTDALMLKHLSVGRLVPPGTYTGGSGSELSW